MKITKTHLRQIIKEELEAINEIDLASIGGMEAIEAMTMPERMQLLLQLGGTAAVSLGKMLAPPALLALIGYYIKTYPEKVRKQSLEDYEASQKEYGINPDSMNEAEEDSTGAVFPRIARKSRSLKGAGGNPYMRAQGQDMKDLLIRKQMKVIKRKLALLGNPESLRISDFDNVEDVLRSIGREMKVLEKLKNTPVDEFND
jgi:hypothetical protein